MKRRNLKHSKQSRRIIDRRMIKANTKNIRSNKRRSNINERNIHKKKRKINKSKVYGLIITIIFIIYIIINNNIKNGLESNLKGMQEDKNTLQEQINTLNDSIDGLNKTINTIESENEDYKKQISDSRSDNDKIRNELEETKKQVTGRGSTTENRINNTNQKYRITSYHPGDNYSSSTKTGSGKTIKDFNTKLINGKKVYTYQGKIVVATATQELLKSGYSVKGSQEKQNKHYFKYYDTLQIKIDNNWYDAIVLDSCGASMWKNQYRIDIFVPSAKDVINKYEVDIKY